MQAVRAFCQSSPHQPFVKAGGGDHPETCHCPARMASTASGSPGRLPFCTTHAFSWGSGWHSIDSPSPEPPRAPPHHRL